MERLRLRWQRQVLHVPDYFADLSGLAGSLENFRDRARYGGGDFDRGFVGLDLDQVFILGGVLAFAFEPLTDLDFGDRFPTAGTFSSTAMSPAFERLIPGRGCARARGCCHVI